ncbi:MAG TPA: hypothetical protein VN228_01300 [Pyrinomonadaceae bacterium]|nr:hypothetical protein [Pyrinomonadaceae bacterium]
MSKTLYPSLAAARLCALALLLVSPAASAQEPGARPTPAPAAKASAPKSDEKAEEIVRRAVDALGGAAYLDVRTVVSHGYFTPYHDGVATLPVRFEDYLVFPDRERTHFRGSIVNSIQTNTGETGWVADLKMKKLTDITPAQAEDFRLTMRVSLDNVLRGWWRSEGAALTYVGRREAGLGRRNEAVRLSYPDGFTVEFEFSARDALPSKALYRKQNSEGELVEEEDRYAQFQEVGSVRAPFIIDHFRAGVQSSRVNFEAVEFNRPVPDSLFTRPADVKALK